MKALDLDGRLIPEDDEKKGNKFISQREFGGRLARAFIELMKKRSLKSTLAYRKPVVSGTSQLDNNNNIQEHR